MSAVETARQSEAPHLAGPRTLTASEAAATIGVSIGTVRAWADRGILPSFRTVGGHRRFEVHELKRWLAARGASMPEVPGRRARAPDVRACPEMARWLNSRVEEVAARVLAGYDPSVRAAVTPKTSAATIRRSAGRFLGALTAALEAGRAGALAGRAELAGFRSGGVANAFVVAEHTRFATAVAREAEEGIATGAVREPWATASLHSVIDRMQAALVSGFHEGRSAEAEATATRAA